MKNEVVEKNNSEKVIKENNQSITMISSDNKSFIGVTPNKDLVLTNEGILVSTEKGFNMPFGNGKRSSKCLGGSYPRVTITKSVIAHIKDFLVSEKSFVECEVGKEKYKGVNASDLFDLIIKGIEKVTGSEIKELEKTDLKSKANALKKSGKTSDEILKELLGVE